MTAPPVASLVAELLGGLRGRGMNVEASPQLRQYLREAHGYGLPSEAPADPKNLVAGPGSGFTPDLYGQLIDVNPTISRDPWFEELEVPQVIYSINKKTGKKTRVDGPFRTRDELERRLERIIHMNTSDLVTFEAGPPS